MKAKVAEWKEKIIKSEPRVSMSRGDENAAKPGELASHAPPQLILRRLFSMKIRRFVTRFQYSMVAVILMTASPRHVLAQNSNSNTSTRQRHQPVLNQQSMA